MAGPYRFKSSFKFFDFLFVFRYPFYCLFKGIPLRPYIIRSRLLYWVEMYNSVRKDDLEDVKVVQELKENRVFKVKDQADGRYFVIKILRPEGPERESISLVNELVCFRLGDKLEVPVAETRPIAFRGKVGLCRPWFEKNICEWYEKIGSDRFMRDLRYNCTHFWTVREPYIERLQKSALKEILVFDQWVWALDRVPHNVMTNQDLELKAIDYEHSLSDGTGVSYPEYYRNVTQVLRSTERCHPTQMSHGVGDRSQIQKIVDRIEHLNRNEIKNIVLGVTDDVLNCQQQIGGKIGQENIRSKSIIIVKILLVRRDNLSKLMRDLLDSWGKVLENNKCRL